VGLQCIICDNPRPSKTIPVCPSCAKSRAEIAETLHKGLEIIGGSEKASCNLCSNQCRIEDEGLCRIRFLKDGKIVSRSTTRRALLHAYKDPLPTNCCNAWFCKGSSMFGYNLAVFYYGCNFDCLYCQNWQHKHVNRAPPVTVDDMVRRAMDETVKCICHFGGSPEPQMGFALNFSRLALEKRSDIMICWEWNGAGNTKLALEAAKLSSESGGTVKFDLKAWNEDLHVILTGRSNRPVHKNFEAIFEKYPEVLSVTTLLVPYYVDAEEVEGIASFMASLSPEIPYSLLIFHPDYRLRDLPITPRNQVLECYKVAKKHLRNVNIGNIHLLG
jgi:pyruvate formate lyase activating enzyme